MRMPIVGELPLILSVKWEFYFTRGSKEREVWWFGVFLVILQKEKGGLIDWGVFVSKVVYIYSCLRRIGRCKSQMKYRVVLCCRSR